MENKLFTDARGLCFFFLPFITLSVHLRSAHTEGYCYVLGLGQKL